MKIKLDSKADTTAIVHGANKTPLLAITNTPPVAEEITPFFVLARMQISVKVRDADINASKISDTKTAAKVHHYVTA